MKRRGRRGRLAPIRRLEVDPRNPPVPSPPAAKNVSLAGLLLGGVSLGLAQTLRGLRRLERESAETPLPPPSRSSETETDLVRHALTGFAVEAGRASARDAATVARTSRLLARRLPVSRLPGAGLALDAARSEADRLETRGRRVVERFAEVGRVEEARAGATADSTFQQVAATSIDQIAELSVTRLVESDRIHELLVSQSSTLLEDLVDTVRAYADRWNDEAEAWARKVFRRGRPRPPLVIPVTQTVVVPTVVIARREPSDG